MTMYLVAAFGYLIVPFFLTWLICFAHKRVFIVNKMQKMPRSRQNQSALPKPLWPKFKERWGFAFKDDRPFSLNSKKPKESGTPTKQVVRLTWLSGLVAVLAGLALSMPILFAIAPLAYLTAVIMAIITASPVLKARQQLFQKMYEVGQSTLGLPQEFAENPQGAVQVLEWRGILSPSKVRFMVPTKFNADSEETFQRQFNQVFGTESTWVPFNDPEAKTPGWDYTKGFVTLKETPPLPQKAPWSAHYVLDPSVAWSFFPIALGVEGGLEIANPETGETENVLGFDLSGEQAGLSAKMGTYCSPSITTSPMGLVAGGTGGGKSLSLDTQIRVILRENDSNTENLSV